MLEDDVEGPGLPDQFESCRDSIHVQRNDVVARIHPLVCVATDGRVALPRGDDSEIAPGTTGALVVARIPQ